MPDATALTPLAVMVLALLREGEMHPYEMMRLIERRREERLVRLQKGTLYHTVGRLERDGLVSEVGIDRAGNRPERTTYALTPDGDRAVEAWIRAELPRVDHPAEFRVALAEAHNLERAEVVALLDTRRELLVGALERIRDRLDDGAARAVPVQFLVEADRERALLQSEIAWQDALCARLRTGDLAWGLDELPEDHISDRLLDGGAPIEEKTSA